VNVSVSTDTKSNDRVIQASTFSVDDQGCLRLMDKDGLLTAVFAPGQWVSAVSQ
jgi:hypothetical protein